MSCTIFYKGTLKENWNPDDVFNTVLKHVQKINAELEQFEDSFTLHFLQGKSEPLEFQFRNKRIDSFCRWNGENPEEFYAILDMFIELKPLFKLLNIKDDDGLWHEYVVQKQPCKIKLRPLSSDEMKFLDRAKVNEINPPSEIEKFVISQSGLTPISLEAMNNHMRLLDQIKTSGISSPDELVQFYASCQSQLKPGAKPFYHALLRIIAQDFIKIMDICNLDDFSRQDIVDLTNKLKFFGENSVKEEVEHFDFNFHRMLIEIWVSYAFNYKDMGIVKELKGNIRGFATTKEAALCGITSIFLNRHSGGASNSKEAEMRKLAKKYYKIGALGEVVIVDKPEKELEFFFSMMDFLGLNYVGYDEKSASRAVSIDVALETTDGS